MKATRVKSTFTFMAPTSCMIALIYDVKAIGSLSINSKLRVSLVIV